MIAYKKLEAEATVSKFKAEAAAAVAAAYVASAQAEAKLAEWTVAEAAVKLEKAAAEAAWHQGCATAKRVTAEAVAAVGEARFEFCASQGDHGKREKILATALAAETAAADAGRRWSRACAALERFRGPGELQRAVTATKAKLAEAVQLVELKKAEVEAVWAVAKEAWKLPSPEPSGVEATVELGSSGYFDYPDDPKSTALRLREAEAKREAELAVWEALIEISMSAMEAVQVASH